MHATRAAVEEGILPGGGTALLYATNVLKNLKVENDDQRYGVDIVKKTKTIGRSLKGGIRASYKLSSTSVVVFITIFFNFETASFAKILLIRSAKIIEIKIIPKSS